MFKNLCSLFIEVAIETSLMLCRFTVYETTCWIQLYVRIYWSLHPVISHWLEQEFIEQCCLSLSLFKYTKSSVSLFFVPLQPSVQFSRAVCLGWQGSCLHPTPPPSWVVRVWLALSLHSPWSARWPVCLTNKAQIHLFDWKYEDNLLKGEIGHPSLLWCHLCDTKLLISDGLKQIHTVIDVKWVWRYSDGWS